MWPYVEIKSSPNIPIVTQKIASHFYLKSDGFKITQKVTVHLGYFLRTFVTKYFKKSPNLVTLITSDVIVSRSLLTNYLINLVVKGWVTKCVIGSYYSKFKLMLQGNLGTSVTSLGNFFNPLATIKLSKCPHSKAICKGVKIYHFSSEICFGQLL